MLQNSICWMTRFSMSSSPMFPRRRSFAQPNSSFILRASTTVTMQSSLGMPFPVYSGPIMGMEQIVLAMGSGSQIPLASMTM